MKNHRAMLYGATALAAWASGTTAIAQSAQPAPDSSAESVELAQDSDGASVDDIVVTGSLIVRNGDSAPTPVTIVDTESLQKLAPSNIPDALNQLPQFSGSLSQSANPQNGTATRPNAGNYLNLRNLGIIRSLILLDGQRVPPTSFEGTVDTNVIPQALIQRVDVVTAGASATYGSDAVTGVVNFVLDKKFTGLKGSAQRGISTYGDDGSYRLSLAGGHGFFEDRAHVLFSYEHYDSEGIADKTARPLFLLQPVAYPIIANGVTTYRTYYGGRSADTSIGGAITTGPLRYQKFNPDGTLSPYDRGSPSASGGIQVGGDGSIAQGGQLVGALKTDQAFGRVSYDVTSNISAYAQVMWARSVNEYAHLGTDNRFNNITIFSGNAFLLPEQQAVLDANNTASFKMSRQGTEQGRKVVRIDNRSTSILAGLEGKLGSNWNWNIRYAHGESTMYGSHSRNPQNQRYFAAIDAVIDPGTGNTVCRVTLTNPGLYPGCVPLNILGANRASDEALEYVFGEASRYTAKNKLDDVAFTVSGSLFALPAGDVGMAVGGEYRKQSLSMISNADPAIPLDLTGIRGFPAGALRFGNTNQGSANGSYNVKEVFGEIVVPILKDSPIGQSLELNLAGRLTDYSTSGEVETWKIGGSYVPIDGLRFRGTFSRDIRAPTLNELFAGQQAGSNSFFDIHTGVIQTIQQVTGGNASLTPEKGTTLALGTVLQPSFLRDFSVAVDFYRIKITDAIGTQTASQVNQDCEDSGGTLPSCALIIRPGPFSDRSPANAPIRVLQVPQNIASIMTRGLDVDASYRIGLGGLLAADDSITLRGLANYSPVYRQKLAPNAPVRQLAGTLEQGPKWRLLISGDYTGGPVTLGLQARYIGPMIRSNQASIVYLDNKIGGVWYFNATGNVRIDVGETRMELFLNINNLFNRKPPVVPRASEPGLTYPTSQNYYDVIGRYMTAGVRFRL